LIHLQRGEYDVSFFLFGRHGCGCRFVDRLGKHCRSWQSLLLSSAADSNRSLRSAALQLLPAGSLRLRAWLLHRSPQRLLA
jgi:hypothetical protein